MEEEAREILKAGLAPKPLPKANLAQTIRKYMDPLGGVELVLPVREPVSYSRTLSIYARRKGGQSPKWTR